MSLFTSCKEGNIERVKELIEQGVNIAMCNNLALHLACEHGHISIVSLLLQDWRIEPKAYDNYAIITASQQGHTDIVKLLLQDGRADPAAEENWSIKMASINGHTKVVEMLLKDGRVDPTNDNEWAIKYAKTEEIREMLIAYKYRVDGQEYCKAVQTLSL